VIAVLRIALLVSGVATMTAPLAGGPRGATSPSAPVLAAAPTMPLAMATVGSIASNGGKASASSTASSDAAALRRAIAAERARPAPPKLPRAAFLSQPREHGFALAPDGRQVAWLGEHGGRSRRCRTASRDCGWRAPMPTSWSGRAMGAGCSCRVRASWRCLRRMARAAMANCRRWAGWAVAYSLAPIRRSVMRRWWWNGRRAMPPMHRAGACCACSPAGAKRRCTRIRFRSWMRRSTTRASSPG